MTALSKSLPQSTGWHTKEHLMVVWRENHAFHSGGLDHSVKKLTFPRQLSILFPFSGIALEVVVFSDLEVARGHATLPLVISMITNLTVLVVSLPISTLKQEIASFFQLPPYWVFNLLGRCQVIQIFCIILKNHKSCFA